MIISNVPDNEEWERLQGITPRPKPNNYVSDGIYREECPFIKAFGGHVNRTNGYFETIKGRKYFVDRYDCCGQIFRKVEINETGNS